MGKSVLLLSMLGTILLFFVGLVDPNNPIMWMASVDPAYQALRMVIIAILVALLVTEPPRNRLFRTFVGLISLVATGWALSSTFQNQMQLLDTMTILQASITAWLTILERPLATRGVPARNNIAVKHVRHIAVTS